MEWFYLISGISVIIILLCVPKVILKYAFAVGLLVFFISFLFIRSLQGAVILAGLSMLGFISLFLPSITNNQTVKTKKVYKEPRKTWSDKQAEKKAEKEAYYQSLIDEDEELAIYEDDYEDY